MRHGQEQDFQDDSTSDDDPSPRDTPKSNSNVSSSHTSNPASVNNADKKVDLLPTSSPLSTRNRNNFETPVWDDSLDID